MAKGLAIAAISACMFTLSGCGAPSGPAPVSQVTVAGTVNLDGKPMPDGQIVFTSPGMSGALIPIKDGKFEGKSGTGDKKPEIRAFRTSAPVMMGDKPGPTVEENYIPARYNIDSKQTVKIEAAGRKDLTFDVESK
jgi:hypothetical protein